MSGESPANTDDEYWTRNMQYARNLVQQLEAGNRTEADHIINELSKIRENELYREVGKLTRDLHEKINTFVDESRLRTIMQEDIPDARDRLSYVIKLTEESAHNTLESVEHCMPLVDALGLRAKEIKGQWQEFMHNRKGVEALRTLIDEMDVYLQQVIDDASNIHNDMFDVLLAQSYQDITGQVLQRVIDLVQSVEHSLVDIVQTSGQHQGAEADMKKVSAKKKEAGDDSSGHGPAVPGIASNDVMNSQDDVDDLLSTLGF